MSFRTRRLGRRLNWIHGLFSTLLVLRVREVTSYGSFIADFPNSGLPRSILYKNLMMVQLDATELTPDADVETMSDHL